MEAFAKELSAVHPVLANATDDYTRQPAEQKRQHRLELHVRHEESDDLAGDRRENVKEVLANLQQHLEKQGLELKFTLREESGQIQVEMIDAQSDKVIRKVPSDELLKLSTSLKDFARGFLDRAV